MEFRFASRPDTEIFVNTKGGVCITQEVPYETERAIITFSYQDIPAIVEALLACGKEAEGTVRELIEQG